MTEVLDPTKPYDPDLWGPYEAGVAQEPPGAKPPKPPADPTGSRAARIKRLTYRRSELTNIPPPSYLIDGVLNRNVLAVLAGKFGTYKSFISVSWACSVATGVPWLGQDIVNEGPVVYVAAEGASGIRSRIEAWESMYNRGRMIADDRLAIVGGSVNLGREGDVDALNEVCAEVKPVLLIWDTLHRCAPGIEENSNTEMGLVVETLDGIRERHGCTQLLNHHTGHKGERGRGASSIEDDCENSWVVKLGGDGEDRSVRTSRTMEHRKTKDDETSEPIPIRLAICDTSATIERVPDGDLAPSSEFIIEAKVKAKAAECDAAGIPKSFGRDKLKLAAQRAGVPGVGDNIWTRVVKLRKAA